MNNDELKSPSDIIRNFYPLQGVVQPLVELIKVNPELTESIIELALVYGIRAARHKLEQDVEWMLKPIASNIDITYGDLMRSLW